MRARTCYLSSMLLMPCLGAASAFANVVYFSDNFDTKINPTDNPQIGEPYNTAGTTGSPFSLSTNPAIGLQSLELQRNSNPPPPFPNPTLLAIGLNGALTDQNNVQYSWDEYIQSANPYNAPVQVQMGYDNGSAGLLDFVGVNDPGSGSFFYTDANGNQVATGVHPTLNQWDHLRVVFHLSEFISGGSNPNYMTGTMDYYVTLNELNGGVEQALATGVPLPYALIPTDDPSHLPIQDSTAPTMKIQKGPFTGITYYDNLLIQQTGSVPEPVSVAGLLVCGSIGLCRRVRKPHSELER